MNKKIGIVLLCMILSTPVVYSTSGKTPNKSIMSEVDKFITKVQEQSRALKQCIHSLNVIIVKEKKFSKKKRSAIQKHFSQLAMLIESVEQTPFRSADLQSCQLLINFNEHMVNHLDTIRLNGFAGIEKFDIEKFLLPLQQKRALQGPEIFKKFQQAARKISIIKKEGLGLSRTNRMMRWIDDKIITPSQRHSITSRSLIGLGTVFIGSYIWWHINKDQFQQTVHPWWYGWFGDHLDDHETYNQASSPGIISSIDHSLSRAIHGKAEIGKYLGGLVLGAYATELYKNILPKVDKKIRTWINKGKGGAYVKEAQRIEEKAEKVRFKDIYGHDEIKRYFKFLVDYLEDSETHDRQGIRPSRGVLCIGDTRTGKTFCINAFLEEVNQMLIRTAQIGKFKLIKPSVLKIKIEGMEKILAYAKQNAPCILFIDEIDLLDLQRTGENRTLSEFLTAMSDTVNSNDSKKQVFIIAATNCPETLDKALRQPGRFGKELRFEYPNFEDRVHFLESKIFEFVLPGQEDNFNITKLAHYSNNQSYEAMNLFIKDAMMKAKIDNNGELTQRHLEQALEENVYHIIPSCSKDIPEDERNILAAHFAGQAVALTLLNSNLKLGKVTLKQVMTELKEEMMGSHLYASANKEQQRFEYGKIFTYHDKDSINMQTRDEKMALMKMHVAGFVAEEMLLGSCGYSCHSEKDHNAAITLAKSLTFQGVDESTLPKHLVKEYYDRALEIKQDCVEEVKDLLANNREKLELVMQELIKQQTLDQEQVQEITTTD